MMAQEKPVEEVQDGSWFKVAKVVSKLLSFDDVVCCLLFHVLVSGLGFRFLGFRFDVT